MSPAGPHRAGRRLARPDRLAIVGLLVLALLAASFVAGRFFQPPRTADPAAVSQPIDVWAAVEQRVVDTSASFAGTVAAGKTRSVAVTAEGPAVVLRQTVKPGQTVRPGDVAGEVSGVTYVFLPEPLALYRDLTEGDTGEDVSSLQRALEKVGHTAGKDGVLDARTARALRELFQEAGAPLPQDTPVSVGWRQFIPLGSGGAQVVSAAGYGATLTDDQPLLRLQTSPPSVQFTADVTQAAALRKGQPVRVAAGSAALEGTVAAIGDFQAAQGEGRAGHTITVALGEGAEVPPVGQSVSVSTAPETTAEPGLAVPLTAVRGMGSDAYVILRDDAATATGSGAGASARPDERRVPVTVGVTGGGYAAVTGELEAGDRVKVS